MYDENDEEYEVQKEFDAFKEKIWKLERVAKKHNGCIKWVPVKATKLKAYAAKMYRAVSGLGWDIPDIVPGEGEVCAFNLAQWVQHQQDWAAFEVIRKASSRLTLAVVVGEMTEKIGQTLVKHPREIFRFEV